MEGLDQIFTLLAEYMGATKTLVEQDGHRYLLEFSKYRFAKEMMHTLIVGGLIAFLTAFLTIFFIEPSYENDENATKKSLMIGGIIWVSLVAIGLVATAIPYFVSPEFYGLEQLRKLL